RGAVVTLLDVRTRLGHPRPAGPAEDRRIIVIDHESEPIGFEVDRVLRVVKIDEHDIEPHPVVHMSEANEAVSGVFRHGDALTILLDFAKLLGSRGPVSVFRGRSAGMRAPKS
ncbi:MAG: chemotaxis protein CheW, partial [Thermoanaerobaculia bacterium]